MTHNDKIKDTETHFKIDPFTRGIINESAANNTIVQYDHNSERFTFEIPRYVDGHDMAESTEVRVHYRNSSANGLNKTNGIYICDDLAVADDKEDTVTFSWLLSSATTQFIGYLYFSIQFVCLTGETVDYAWNTGIYKDIVIIESINNTDDIVTDNIDALIAYKNEIIEEIKNSIGPEIAASISTSRIAQITLWGSNWIGGDNLYWQNVEIEGVTKNSQVDLTPSAEQLAIFYEKDIAFVTENVDGVVTVYAIGQKIEGDYTIQVTITEVKYE